MLEYIRPTSLRLGDKLGRTIYNSQGNVLIKAGISLTEKMITNIQIQGYKGIYINRIENTDRENIHIQEPVIDDYTIIKVISILSIILNNKNIFTNPWDDNFTKCRQQLEEYVDEFYKIFIERNVKEQLMFEMEDGRTNDNWIEYHSFNTMQLAMSIAIRLGFTETEVKGIGIAGLMHDVGKAKYPGLMNKQKLTDEEKIVLRTHPRIIFEILTCLSGIYASTYCTYGCWQSHELYDGTGYPIGLSDNKITIFGYIVGVASRFDNLVHITPFNDSPMTNNEALEYLMGSNYYQVEVIKALTQIVSAYPVGTKVKLSNGESGLVISNNMSLPLRPNVSIGYKKINLASDDEYRNVTIQEVSKT